MEELLREGFFGSLRKNDETGKIYLPISITKTLNWEANDKLLLLINSSEDKLKLVKYSNNEVFIDKAGMITIPKTILDDLDWDVDDIISFNISDDFEAMYLNMHQRCRKECAFCYSEEVVLKVERFWICREHLEYIVNARIT